jgi:hypothetical protein
MYATKKVRGYTPKCVKGANNTREPKMVNNRKCYVAGACDGRRKLKGANFFEVYPKLLDIPGITPNREIFEDAAKFSCSAKDGGIQRCSNRPHMLSMLWQEFKPYAKLKTMVDMVLAFQRDSAGCFEAGAFDETKDVLIANGTRAAQAGANTVDCAQRLMFKLQQPDFGTGAQLKEFRKMVKDYMEKAENDYHSADAAINNGVPRDMCPESAYQPIPDAWETKPEAIRANLALLTGL